MSNRNIKQSALDYLATASSVKIAHLIKFDIPTEDEAGNPTITTAYLTDFMSNVTWDSKVYEAGKVTKVGDVRQAQGLTNYKLSVDVAGEYQEELDRGLVENLKYSYVGNELEVLRAYIDTDGSIIPFDIDSNGPMQYFIGDITNIDIKEAIVSGTSTVTWQCAGNFQDFDIVNGRITDDKAHRGLVSNQVTGIEEPSDGAKAVSHQTDRGFQHANQTINIITQYTTTETKYKMKKRNWWQSKKLVSYEEEVERELELGVSLSAKFLPKIYGVQKTAGIPVFIDAVKDDPTKIYVVYAFSEGSIDAFLNFFIEGKSLICSSEQDRRDRLCLGNQANGDTLSAFMSNNSDYQAIIDAMPRHPRETWQPDQPYQNVDLHIAPIVSEVTVDKTKGTEQGDFFTISNDTGTKWIRVYHGHSDQLACEELVDIAAAGNFLNQAAWVAAEPGRLSSEYWDASCRLLDTSYVVMQFAITEEETSVPTLDAIISGSGVSTFDSGLVETPDDYTLNPVWHLRDYMIDPLCGGALSPASIDLPSFQKVAAEMDTITNSYENSFLTYWRYAGWKNSTDDANRAVMQCNTLFKSELTVTKNIKVLLDQFDGTLNIIGGKYHLSVEGADATVADIDVSEVIGSIRTKDLSNKNKWNSVQASIVDPGQGWGTTQINFFNSDYLAQDSGVHKKGNIGFTFISNYYTAREWAERMLHKSRYSRELTFSTYFKYLYLKPNDNVTMTYGRFGYNKKTFRVKSCTLKSDGKVNLTLEDFDASIYNSMVSSDESGEVTVSTPTTLPPQNLEYVPLPDVRFSVAIPDSVHGILVWDAPNTSDILRYNVRDWHELGGDSTAPLSQTILDNGVLRQYIFITDLNSIEEYTFKVLTISKTGKLSKYAVVKYSNTNTDPVTFPPVEGFTCTNSVNGVFVGDSIDMTWDAHTSATTYQIEVSDNTGTELRTANVSVGTTNYSYTMTYNMADYASKYAGAVGAYRDLQIKIRATNGLPNGDSDFVSSIWNNLI